MKIKILENLWLRSNIYVIISKNQPVPGDILGPLRPHLCAMRDTSTQ